MANKMLTHETVKEIFNYSPEAGVFTWKVRLGSKVRVGQIAGSLDSKGYIRLRVNSVEYRAHRVAWLYMHGVWPKEQIDHINSVRTDNRIANLREANSSQNNSNRSIDVRNTSGSTGVSFNKASGKWVAYCQVNKTLNHLGGFANKEDAIEARANYIKAQSQKFFKA